MSYLSYPRLHFSGKFQATPSTLNNTPNNYNANVYYTENDSADLQASSNPEQLQGVELYWNPNGTGIFNLVNCAVTKVVYRDGSESTSAVDDPIIGQSVQAVYTKAPPKIVDLDPMQQNVSEVWGLEMQVAGITAVNPRSIPSRIRGIFAPTAFNGIWVQSVNGPRSSNSGSAVFQAQLNDLLIESKSPQSRFLQEVQEANPAAMSLNFVVNAHNNQPPIYSFNTQTFAVMEEQGIPAEVVKKLKPLSLLTQNVGSTEGDVPTESFVNLQLSQLLTAEEISQYQALILAITGPKKSPGQQSYPQTLNEFTFGDLSGTLGLSVKEAPVYFVPSRMMAPYQGATKAFFAPFSVETLTAANNTQRVELTLNLGNSLITDQPGSEAYSEELGQLTLVWFDVEEGESATLSKAQPLADIAYEGEKFKTQAAGFFRFQLSAQQADQIAQKPLGVISQINGNSEILLAENPGGYFMRADRFVYRMNPGRESTSSYPCGGTAKVVIYLLKYGQPADGEQITLTMKTPQEAINYTVNTLGTSGTRGIGCLSIPQSALTVTPAVARVSKGIATFELKAVDPGNLRGYVDGQVYFFDYQFADKALQSTQVTDPNDIVSVQVYQQLLENTAGSADYIPTWDGEIGDILSQYGRLYPIMSRFGLQSYDSVVKNSEVIRNVLEKPVKDALHMPVTRDLSSDRLQLIQRWMDAGMPKTRSDIER